MSDTQPLATQWKRARGEIVELPSGKKARLVQSLNMPAALKAGKIPNPLRTIIEQNINPDPEAKPPQVMDNAEALDQFGALMMKTVCEAFIDPVCHEPPEGENPMTWHPESDEDISYFDLEVDDRYFVYQVAQGGATDLKAFRERQRQFMESLADGEKVQVPPKRASRPRKKKV